MKDGLRQIVGRTIAAVYVAQSGRAPKQQVFLAFQDGTHFELYGDAFTCCAGVDRGDIVRYVHQGGGRLQAAYEEPLPGTVTSAERRRDQEAWRLALKAIAKAKRI